MQEKKTEKLKTEQTENKTKQNDKIKPYHINNYIKY